MHTATEPAPRCKLLLPRAERRGARSLGWATTEREVGTAAVVIAGAVHDLTHRI
jgi:hypothetical protein